MILNTKTKALFTVLLFISSGILLAQNEGPQESKYSINKKDLPEWVQLMYEEQPNIKAVQQAYQDYYSIHTFEKNTYTQYYKRWIRDKWQYMDAEGNYLPPSRKSQQQRLKKYLNLRSEYETEINVTSNWEEIGPWEYDHEATMNLSVQSPGSSHIYTVEQSPSNPDIIWAGTANGGIWKSIDKGMNWERMSADYYIKTVYAIEVDHSDSDIVYMEGNGKIWKTTNGGSTWSATGNDMYFSWTRDIKMHPQNSNYLFAATTNGLYKTSDGGTNWDLVVDGHFQEIEFKPDNPDVIYAVRQNGLHTEFYKSTNGGTSFQKSMNGWPGVISADQTNAFNSFDFENSFSTFPPVNLGSSSIPDFTIELRIKASNWSGDPAFFSNKNWNSGFNKGFVLACNGNNWKFNIGDGSNRIDLNGGFMNDDQWHHICLVYDADGLKQTFHNGQLTDSTSNSISLDVIPNLPMVLAQDGTTNYGYDFNGQIAELRIWNKALDIEEIKSWQCNSIDGSHPSFNDLLHYWKLDEGSGSAFYDSQSNAEGTIEGSGSWEIDNQMDCIFLDFENGEEQRRTEIAVSKSAPNNVYVLAAGSANDGSGLYGFYKSTDAGSSFEFICCGDEAGGIASLDNKNILGYSYELDANGGQYYYDLALDVSPTDSNKIFAAGISVVRSEDGGFNWETNGHWVTWVGQNTKHRYTHADVHDVKFFDNGQSIDMWTASDGGLYYSSNQGDTINPRMFGIQGTEFWGFSSSYLHDAMIGGTYHNGTLLHFEDTYDKGKDGKGGWFAGGAGDATKGYNHPAFGEVMFEGGGMFEVINRLQGWNWLPFDNSKNANMNGQPGRFGNYEWHPNYYTQFYSPRDSVLYKTEDNGQSWTVVHDFQTGPIYRTRIPAADPQTIFTVFNDQSTVRLMKSIDGGLSFADISPPDNLVGQNNWKNKLFDIDQQNPDNIWLLLAGGGVNYKVFKSIDGGQSWEDWTGINISEEIVLDIVHHQGSDGGVYIGTSNAVFYRNNSMDDWELNSDNLPIVSRCGYLYPYYSEGKIRLGTYTGAYQCDLFEEAPPIVKPAVDKYFAECPRDTFYFKDLSYLDRNNASWEWSFPGASFVSSTTVPDPKVVYEEAGVYDVSLQITNYLGQSDQVLISGMVEQGAPPIECIVDCNNKAIGKTAEASSLEVAALSANLAIDGKLNTRWSSQYNNAEWLYVDLGEISSVCALRLYWETALGRDFNIEISNDLINWTPIIEVEDNEEFINTFEDLDTEARYVRMFGIERGTNYGYSLWEFEVYTSPMEIVSTSEPLKNHELIVFPNPVNEELTLSFYSNESIITDIFIYNVNGQLHLTETTTFNYGDNNLTININDLPRGSYFIKVLDSVKYFIKQY